MQHPQVQISKYVIWISLLGKFVNSNWRDEKYSLACNKINHQKRQDNSDSTGTGYVLDHQRLIPGTGSRFSLHY
jgi:hypothetical protein